MNQPVGYNLYSPRFNLDVFLSRLMTGFLLALVFVVITGVLSLLNYGSLKSIYKSIDLLFARDAMQSLQLLLAKAPFMAFVELAGLSVILYPFSREAVNKWSNNLVAGWNIYMSVPAAMKVRTLVSVFALMVAIPVGGLAAVYYGVRSLVRVMRRRR